MDENDILDAPANEISPLEIGLKPVLIALILFPLAYAFYFFLDHSVSLSSYNYDLWKFKFDLSKLIFVCINCIGFYIFISSLKFELSHWFRLMTVSISIVLFSISMIALIVYFIYGLDSLLRVFKAVAFISLTIGGGCSLAMQFLVKKNYVVFGAILICTLAVFSLIEYL